MLVHEFSDSFRVETLVLTPQAVGAGAVRRTPALDLTYLHGDVQCEIPFLSSGGGTLSAKWVEGDQADLSDATDVPDGAIVTGGPTGWHASARRVRSFDRRYVAVAVETAVAASTVGAVVIGQKTDR